MIGRSNCSVCYQSKKEHDRRDFHTEPDNSGTQREARKSIIVTCIDLEKTHGRIPREDIILWRCFMKRYVTENCIRLTQDMHQGCKPVVRSATGESNSFGVEVGLHQDSGLDPIHVPTPDGCVDRRCKEGDT